MIRLYAVDFVFDFSINGAGKIIAYLQGPFNKKCPDKIKKCSEPIEPEYMHLATVWCHHITLSLANRLMAKGKQKYFVVTGKYFQLMKCPQFIPFFSGKWKSGKYND